MSFKVGDKVRIKQGVRGGIGDDWLGETAEIAAIITDYPHTGDFWLVVEDGKVPVWDDEVELITEEEFEASKVKPAENLEPPTD